MSTAAASLPSDPTPSSPTSSSERTAKAREAFTASLTSVGASIDAELQARAKNIHANAKALTKQEDELRSKTKSLAKDGDSLQKLLDKTNKEVANLGDLDSLMAGLDADLAMIEETLRLAEEGDDENSHAEPEGEATQTKP